MIARLKMMKNRPNESESDLFISFDNVVRVNVDELDLGFDQRLETFVHIR